ncbi:MAG: type II toxin-antitoxin system RelE/ParE family toxin [Bacteroidales bacterium]|nr:type II toxin-antitoxin system RelE/ParE family toxin [Bacteroidales bacterium]
MNRTFYRQIVVFENHFKEFRKKLDRETLKKVYQVLTLIMATEVIPKKFLKHIVGIPGLYEIRVAANRNLFRIFCCLDEGKIIILFNGFQKKTRKTPVKEIEVAEKLMKKYFETKEQNENGE